MRDKVEAKLTQLDIHRVVERRAEDLVSRAIAHEVSAVDMVQEGVGDEGLVARHVRGQCGKGLSPQPRASATASPGARDVNNAPRLWVRTPCGYL